MLLFSTVILLREDTRLYLSWFCNLLFRYLCASVLRSSKPFVLCEALFYVISDDSNDIAVFTFLVIEVTFLVPIDVYWQYVWILHRWI